MCFKKALVGLLASERWGIWEEKSRSRPSGEGRVVPMLVCFAFRGASGGRGILGEGHLAGGISRGDIWEQGI